ncbi:hypothetical protein EOD41_09805 [Mucilaginibacter limnophilus]|uniref:Uncharacterized protein n=1 Tax=Mucilaginibacter limnophilus TaxID=1932778 RepID=A0A437MTD8_9SPHI|nr:hypothetical protein [Mucilaginibacter limnophilus]RVU00919.1 hypothetical protein EOD41_09805 [Mucilaginibacter limnophilus]
MFYLLIAAAVVLFLLHVMFLLMSFRGGALVQPRYFYSHLTLWLTGACVFFLAFLYSGKSESRFLDYFDSPSKLAAILISTMTLSLVAHLIVRYLVVPALRK